MTNNNTNESTDRYTCYDCRFRVVAVDADEVAKIHERQTGHTTKSRK